MGNGSEEGWILVLFPAGSRDFSTKCLGTTRPTVQLVQGDIFPEGSATQYCAGDKIEENEMGGACGTYGERERCAQGFGGET